MKAFIDSDILIWHLRGEKRASKLLKRLRENREYELWVGAMQRAEVTFFMRDTEKEATMFFLSQFETASVSDTIVDLAAGLYHKWHPSHGIDVNDALLAATAILNSGKIFCMNKKHYPMPEVHVEKGW